MDVSGFLLGEKEKEKKVSGARSTACVANLLPIYKRGRSFASIVASVYKLSLFSHGLVHHYGRDGKGNFTPILSWTAFAGL